MNMNQRRSERYETRIPVSLCGSARECGGRILNFSAGGLFVETGMRLAEQQVIDVFYILAGRRRQPILFRGIVAHSTDDGAGIEIIGAWPPVVYVAVLCDATARLVMKEQMRQQPNAFPGCTVFDRPASHARRPVRNSVS
jgi:hypothetical protein